MDSLLAFHSDYFEHLFMLFLASMAMNPTAVKRLTLYLPNPLKRLLLRPGLIHLLPPSLQQIIVRLTINDGDASEGVRDSSVAEVEAIPSAEVRVLPPVDDTTALESSSPPSLCIIANHVDEFEDTYECKEEDIPSTARDFYEQLVIETKREAYG